MLCIFHHDFLKLKEKRRGQAGGGAFSPCHVIPWLASLDSLSWTLITVAYGAFKNNKGYEIRISGVGSQGMDFFLVFSF